VVVPDEQTPPYNGLGGVNGIGLKEIGILE
jgi:hypothetical protein